MGECLRNDFGAFLLGIHQRSKTALFYPFRIVCRSSFARKNASHILGTSLFLVVDIWQLIMMMGSGDRLQFP